MGGERLVENRQRCRLEHRPGLPRERRGVVLPGTEEVAPPEQLQAAAAFGHQDAATDQTLEHEEAEMVDRRLARIRLPGAAPQLHHDGEQRWSEAVARARRPRQRTRELWVALEQVDTVHLPRRLAAGDRRRQHRDPVPVLVR